MKKKSWLLGILLIFVVFLMGACGEQETVEGPVTEPTTEETLQLRKNK